MLLAVGAFALAATSFSTPTLARPGDEGGRSERAAPQRPQQAPRMNQAPQARPQRTAPVAPAARGNDAPRANWQHSDARPQQARPPQARPQQVRPQQDRPQSRPVAAQEPRANEIRRNLPGWAGGTRSGEPMSPNGSARPNTDYRPNDRGNDRDRDRDRGSSWQRDNDRRDDNDRWRDNDRRGDNWRGDDRRNGNDRWRGNDNQNRNWDRNGWRRDTRYDWQSYRNRNRSTYRIGRYYAPYQNYSYRRLGIGFSLGSMFYGNRYWINDPWQYRLPAVYGPYRWVRYYDDVLLVDTYTGEVVDVIYDFFW
ncbi:MAG TPA: RcnB family protein [Novosphingobium sp.]|nr:RcnB family protein [Novosphingobium sp.]